MKIKGEIFGKFEDETGETYYCPINEVSNNRIFSEYAVVNCVEASTAGRYSGNITVADRFSA